MIRIKAQELVSLLEEKLSQEDRAAAVLEVNDPKLNNKDTLHIMFTDIGFYHEGGLQEYSIRFREWDFIEPNKVNIAGDLVGIKQNNQSLQEDLTWT